MTNPLVLKLSSFVDLSPAEIERVNRLSINMKTHRAHRTLIRQGDRPEVVFLLLKGWAYRYKVLADGGRQIVAYLLPGDLCDVQIFILKEMDHAIGLLSDAEVAEIPKQQMMELFDDCPNLARGLWWSTMVDQGTLREWIANVGRRDAFTSIAHLFCELWVRMKMVGLVEDHSIALPLTQDELADTVGLTSVHVNRTLQLLRSKGLIESQQRRLFIPDIKQLMDVAGFDPNYLHLARRLPRTAERGYG